MFTVQSPVCVLSLLVWVQRAFEQLSELLTTVLNLSSLFFFVDSTTVALHDAQLKIILICLLLRLDVALSLQQAVSVPQFDKAVTDDRKSGKASWVNVEAIPTDF